MSKTIPDIMKTVTPSPSLKSISKTASSPTPSISQQSKMKTPVFNDNGVYIMKMILVIGVLAFLIYNIYIYYNEGTDILGKYLGIGVEKTADATGAVVDTAATGSKKIVSTVEKGSDFVTGGVRKGGEAIRDVSESPLERAVDRQKRRQKNMVDQDVSTESSIQNPKKPGYCYIGTDRTFRSCVKIDEDDVCLSGKIFPSRDICINPNLRR
tara:strand:- start:103 stop:735 length:633 start_codon:yes stop_codon:yes gene_type:complete